MNLPFQIDLKNKVIVITGGGGVICGTFARAVAACGAKTAILDLRKENADKIAAEITAQGGTAMGVAANVLDIESLKAAKKTVNEAYGTCDILINGAGGNHPKGTTTMEYYTPGDEAKADLISFFDLDPEGVSFVFNLNFLGTLLPTKEFSHALTPRTNLPASSGAKAAVSTFTQWLAVHFSKVGIRVNAIAPGFFVTDQNRALLFDENGKPTARTEKILSQTPMDRFGEVEELVGTLLWLLCPAASSFVNGTVIPVDGGFSAYSGV